MVDPFDLGNTEAERLKQQVQLGDFRELRQYLARTRRAQDWQDRCFVLDWLSPFLPGDALVAASATEPEAADLWLLLGIYYFEMVGQSRGSKIAERTSDEQFRDAATQIHTMMDCLAGVSTLDPDDPTPHIFAMRGLVVFNDFQETLKQEFAEAIRLAPDCVPAYSAMVNARSKKWGGSHEESLQIARTAARSGRFGSDLPVCLFRAHFLVWQSVRIFDKNKAEGDRYLKDPRVNQELNDALDRWIGGNYQAQRSSIPSLHHAALWYYLSGDYSRLKRVLLLTANISYNQVWQQIGDPTKTYSDALQKAMQKTVPVSKKKTGLLGWFNK